MKHSWGASLLLRRLARQCICDGVLGWIYGEESGFGLERGIGVSV